MKRQQMIPSILAGVALAGFMGLANVARSAEVTNLISNNTFEDAVYDEFGNLVTTEGRPRWPWGNRYQWGYPDPDPNVAPACALEAPNTLDKRVIDRMVMCLSDERGLSFWQPSMDDPRLNTSRHIVFNLSRPAARIAPRKDGVSLEALP